MEVSGLVSVIVFGWVVLGRNQIVLGEERTAVPEAKQERDEPGQSHSEENPIGYSQPQRSVDGTGIPVKPCCLTEEVPNRRTGRIGERLVADVAIQRAVADRVNQAGQPEQNDEGRLAPGVG